MIDQGLAAQLFVDCFIDQWAWYFEELTGSENFGDKRFLLRAAEDYVRGSDVCLGATVEGSCVGLSVLRQRGSIGLFHTGVGVLPEFRGLRIGTDLTSASLEWFARQGIRAAEVRTQAPVESWSPQVAMYVNANGRVGREFVTSPFVMTG